MNIPQEVLDELDLTQEQAQAIVVPDHIGPTWERTPLGQWKLPEFTLGWQIAAWAADYLQNDGQPWKFTLEQLRFVLWWYAVDEHGEFAYRSGVLQRCKGWGKDPLLAVLCLVEFVGPCRFGGWDADGQPIAISQRDAWVQIAAVSKDQTRNTMRVFPSIITDKLISTYGIKDGKELWSAENGKRHMEAVTSSYRALEGGRSTFVVLNETHHWVKGNDGHLMYETVDGNASKMSGRYMAITNAPLPGEDSVAERMRLSYEKSVEREDDSAMVMYDSLEAKPGAPISGPLLDYVLEGVRGDAYWLKPGPIKASIRNGTISVARSRRMWLNQILAEEDALHGPETWGPLGIPDAELQPGDEIVLGFDGGKTDDATALVAIRLYDNCAFLIGIWQRPETMAAKPRGNNEPQERWEVPRESVRSTVHDTFAAYKVVGFYSDVALWESDIASWEEAYGDQLQVKATGRGAIAWDMRTSLKKSTLAHERLLTAIFDQTLRHDENLTLRSHVLAAKRRVNNFGVSFGKDGRESSRKVDAYAALMLAWEAACDWRTSGKKTKARSTLGVFI